MNSKPSVWTSRATFPGLTWRWESCFELSIKPGERTSSAAEVAATTAPHDSVIVGLQVRGSAAERAGDRLAPAALDVFEREPAVHAALPEPDHVLFSPHVPGATHDGRRAMTAIGVDHVLAVLAQVGFAGQPRSILNPQVLSTAGLVSPHPHA